MKKLAAVLAGVVLACAPANAQPRKTCLPAGWTFVSYTPGCGHVQEHTVLLKGSPVTPRVFQAQSCGRVELIMEHGACE